MPVFARQLKALDYHSPDAIKLIANHIRTMQEELEYRLAHLDSSNISEIDASQTNIITKDGDLYTILNTLEDQQAKLEIGYDHILSEVSSYEETVEGYRQEVSRLEQTTDGFRATVEAYETTLEGYEQQLSSYEQTVEGFNQTVAEYKTSVAGYEAKVSEFNQTVDGFSQTVTEYETTLEGYTSQVSGFEQTVDGFNTTVQNYEKDLEGYKAQVSTYEQTVDGFRQEVSSYKEDVSGYKDQVSSFEQTVNGFETTVSNYESAVSGYAAQVSKFQQTAAGFEATVSEYTDAVEGYEDALSTTLKMDSKGVYIVDQDGNTVSISGGQVAAGTVTTDKIKLYGDLKVYTTSTYGVVGGYMGYASSKLGGSGMRLASSNSILGVESYGYGQSEAHVTDNGAFLRYNFTASKSNGGTVTSAQMGVSGDGTGNFNAAVFIGDLKYYFAKSAFYTQSSGTRATLGTSSQLWGQIYSTNSTISTSDRNAKNSIEYDMDSRYDVLWSLLKPCTGKYNDGTSDRTHMFLISQDVEEAIEQAGLTSLDFAAFIKSPREDEDGNIIGGHVYGLRYEEFIPLCIRHIQLLEARVAELERS